MSASEACVSSATTSTSLAAEPERVHQLAAHAEVAVQREHRRRRGPFAARLRRRRQALGELLLHLAGDGTSSSGAGSGGGAAGLFRWRRLQRGARQLLGRGAAGSASGAGAGARRARVQARGLRSARAPRRRCAARAAAPAGPAALAAQHQPINDGGSTSDDACSVSPGTRARASPASPRALAG